jgi:hypothetical protein
MTALRLTLPCRFCSEVAAAVEITRGRIGRRT